MLSSFYSQDGCDNTMELKNVEFSNYYREIS